MSLFYQPYIREREYHLPEEESRHCAKVLRKRPGDTITVVDGLGMYYEVVLLEAHAKKCIFTIQNETRQPSTPYAIHLILAPTKNTDRMEWMVEKLTEIGIDSIQFVLCQHSERTSLKLDRLQRKAVGAMKQSGRATLPQLLPMIPLTNWTPPITNQSQKFIAHLGGGVTDELFNASRPHQTYYVLIGPEGDFSTDEIQWAEAQGFQAVRLGNYRLRTETAGLFACQSLHMANVR